MTNTRENPYVGPRSFELADQQNFAGRDRDITALYRLLISERIVLLFSPSGAGKSSLVKAGLLPRMIEKGFKILPVVRVSQPLPDELIAKGRVNRYVMSMLQTLEGGWTDDREVSTDQSAALGAMPKAGQEISNDQLAKFSIHEYLTQYLCPENVSIQDGEGISEPRSLMIFDQFEEILTIDPNDDKGKREFFAQLGKALQVSQRWALFVVREDYVAALDPYLRFIPTRLDTTYRLDLLDYESAKEAVQKPASVQGVTYTDTAVENLVNELRSIRIQRPDGSWEPDLQLGRYVEPVQLQVVCNRLWDKIGDDTTITEEKVSREGSVDESLAGFYADKVAETVDEVRIAEKDIRTWFDTALITPNNIRSQVMWEKDQSGGLDNNAISYLEKTHLIRSESRRGVKWLELAHDRLIKPVRDNNRDWFEKNLSLLQRHSMLWVAEGEPERLLLREDELTQAEAWAHDNSLTANEQRYLEACTDLRGRVQAEASKKEAEALAKTNKRLRIRNRIAISAAAIAVLLAVAAVFLGFSAASYATDAENAAATAQANFVIAATARADAVREEDLAKNRSMESAASQLAVQSMTFADIEPQRAVLLALEALNTTQRNHKPAVPAAEQALRYALGSQSGILLPGHNGQIKGVAISDDEHWLATADSKGYIRIWDLTASDLTSSSNVMRDMVEFQITRLHFSPDNRYLVASSAYGDIFIWDIETGDWEYKKSHSLDGRTITDMVFSQDGLWMATGDSEGQVNLFDVKSFEGDGELQPILLNSSGNNPIRVLKFSPDNTKLAAGSDDFIARLWTVESPKNSPALWQTGGPISTLDFSPDSAYLATGGGDDATVRLWNVNATSNEPFTYEKSTSKITVLAFNPNEQPSASDANDVNPRQLFVGHEDGTIDVWRGNGSSLPDKQIIKVSDSPITQLAFSPDGQKLLTGSSDRMARLFEVTNLQAPPRVLRRFGDQITAAVISPAGQWIVVSSDDNEARLWNLKAGIDTAEPLNLAGGTFALSPSGAVLATGQNNDTGSSVFTWKFSDLDKLNKNPVITVSEGSGIASLSISPDDRWLASCGWDGQVRIKDLQDNAASEVLKGSSDGSSSYCSNVKFSPDGSYLIEGDDSGAIKFWDTSKADFGQTDPQSFVAHDGNITALAFSPDGKWMATGSGAGEARIWEMSTLSSGTPWKSIENHTGWVDTVAFSPDSRWLVTGDDGGMLRLQNLSDHDQAFLQVQAHDDWITMAVFSPDGKYLASGSADGTIRLWPVLENGIDENKTYPPLLGHDSYITALAFSPDSKRLASGSSDNTVRLWDPSTPSAEPVVLKGYGDSVNQVEFTKDGNWLVTGSVDGTTRLWHMNLERLQTLACEVVGRNLTEKEWKKFIPQDVKYTQTCSDYPPGNQVIASPSEVEVPTPSVESGTQACSLYSDTPVNLTFTNQSEDSVDLYWIDYNCEPVFYGTLAPGDSNVQGTYATHPWRFIDENTGKVIKDFVTGETDETVTIP